MKTKPLAFLAGFVHFATNLSASSQTQEPSACVGPNPAGLSTPSAGNTAAKSIPFDRLGAEAQKQYSGDGVGITPTADGARLRAAFQDLAAEASPDGLWLESTSDEDTGKPACFRVRAVALGREAGAAFDLTKSGQVRAIREAALYLRPGLIEEYTVSMDGVRQDFVLPQRPAGTGELRVELAVDGARAEAASYGAKFILDGSGRIIAYSRLHVADAKGRELSARLEVAGAGRIEVRLDDLNAIYPICIDPTFSDADWSTSGSGMNGTVRALAAMGADLYAGGDFTTAGGVTVNRIAKWNGSVWSALGAGMDGGVYALAVSGGKLYAGGLFTTAGGVSANLIGQWNGSAWSGLGEGLDSTLPGMSSIVYALAVSDTGSLYVGGRFTLGIGMTGKNVWLHNIGKWDGIDWLGMDVGVNGGVFALAVSGSDLYAGGGFATAGGVLACNIAKWNGGLWVWSALGDEGSGVASANNVGMFTSLAVINGQPAVSYYDYTNADLMYMRAVDANGTEWSYHKTVDSIGEVGGFCSLVVVNGAPAISYIGGANADLKYVRATDASGSAWSAPVTLDSPGDVGRDNSLAVINGQPAVSYYDYTDGDLKFIRNTNPPPFKINWIALPP
jgi:hypothetical protein